MPSDLQSILVHELRVGMYVYLDMHWMRHPFAKNHFLIRTQQQIDTLQSLDCNTVRIRPSLCVDIETNVFNDGDGDDNDVVSTLHTPIESPSEVFLVGQKILPVKFDDAAIKYHQAIEMLRFQPERAFYLFDNLKESIIHVAQNEAKHGLHMIEDYIDNQAVGHGLNVTILSIMLAQSIGIDLDDIGNICLGSLLHDIGKTDLSNKIRYRNNHESIMDFEHYKEHVPLGVGLVNRMGFGERVQTLIAQHHEYVDGTGFPKKLFGDEIHIGAKIIAIVNRYDELCNPAQRVLGLTPHEALRKMYSQEKNRFDTPLMAAFVKMLGIYPPGTYVQLTDDRYALVVSISSTQALKPNVLIYMPNQRKGSAKMVTALEDTPTLGVRRSLRPEQLPLVVARYLSIPEKLFYFFGIPNPDLGLPADKDTV